MYMDPSEILASQNNELMSASPTPGSRGKSDPNYSRFAAPGQGPAGPQFMKKLGQMERVVTKHKRPVKKLAIWDANGRRGAEYGETTESDFYRVTNTLSQLADMNGAGGDPDLNLKYQQEQQDLLEGLRQAQAAHDLAAQVDPKQAWLENSQDKLPPLNDNDTSN